MPSAYRRRTILWKGCRAAACPEWFAAFPFQNLLHRQQHLPTDSEKRAVLHPFRCLPATAIHRLSSSKQRHRLGWLHQCRMPYRNKFLSASYRTGLQQHRVPVWMHSSCQLGLPNKRYPEFQSSLHHKHERRKLRNLQFLSGCLLLRCSFRTP